MDMTAVSPFSKRSSTSPCVTMCHGDHPHDLPTVSTTHEYNAYANPTDATTRGGTTRSATTRAKTDFAPTTGGLCGSCHQNPIAASGPFVDATAYAASAHDYLGTETGTPNYAAYGAWTFTLHDGGVFQRNCTKCHASAAAGMTPQA